MKRKQLRFQFCPNCGGMNIHEAKVNLFDRYIKVYWCSPFYKPETTNGCGWVWCKPFEVGSWVMARNLVELERWGGIPFDENKVLYRNPQ